MDSLRAGLKVGLKVGSIALLVGTLIGVPIVALTIVEAMFDMSVLGAAIDDAWMFMKMGLSSVLFITLFVTLLIALLDKASKAGSKK